MEICVMAGRSFFNEDSEIVRLEGVETDDNGGETVMVKDGTQTTLKAMYADGWILKHVKPIRLTYGILLFFER